MGYPEEVKLVSCPLGKLKTQRTPWYVLADSIHFHLGCAKCLGTVFSRVFPGRPPRDFKVSGVEEKHEGHCERSE